ncbi:molybdenum cofactor cytidylyltransferase [Thermanaeromonas toyohensis ToBE]|uniref:Molybdenum cofactor cytidylyltransferase n=1 Tax=Thermanaeromonas toyohensis ToBE TaxID=698762 RepID=A0A1W1W1S3_9FIRM|nr:molybdenum cofactor cytidylyltransferase [Thermanaeromonas toyohensis]SMB99579.1 molybdenum cofactor cytidylyltransferase [Thermanaeromonas toyohensis ToBE]
MQFNLALELKEKEIITLVGAGGKTSALMCLARELAAQDKRVIVTTTTKMLLSQAQELAEPVISPSIPELLEKVKEKLRKSNLVTCGSRIGEEGKLLGLSLEGISYLARLPVDYLLIEGDGAKGAGLKVPADHEPVIPGESTLVITVMGLKVLGKPLERPWVHRAELIPGLWNKGELPNKVTIPLTATLLGHPLGGRKGVPESSRWVILLNQAEGREEQEAGRLLAEELFRYGPERVILGALKTGAPVRQILVGAACSSTNLGIIVLAAGEARRFGATKQLLPTGELTMVQRVVSTAIQSGMGEVVVVLGHRAEKIVPLFKGYPVHLIFNPSWREGMSTSLKAGLLGLSPRVKATLVLLGDQPGVTYSVLQLLAEAYLKTGKKIVVPYYQGRRGNPVLLDRSLWREIFSLEGDKGARDLLNRYPEEVLPVQVDCAGVVEDIDTPEDYLRWLKET